MSEEAKSKAGKASRFGAVVFIILAVGAPTYLVSLILAAIDPDIGWIGFILICGIAALVAHVAIKGVIDFKLKPKERYRNAWHLGFLGLLIVIPLVFQLQFSLENYVPSRKTEENTARDYDHPGTRDTRNLCEDMKEFQLEIAQVILDGMEKKDENAFKREFKRVHMKYKSMFDKMPSEALQLAFRWEAAGIKADQVTFLKCQDDLNRMCKYYGK